VDKQYDVVVVGGGIAGTALTLVLARGGLSVLLLEREPSYRDKVRGESVTPWGVRELRRLGLEALLLEAGGRYIKRVLQYDEVLSPELVEARNQRLQMLMADVPGFLHVGHPEACAAQSRAAQAVGAHVVCGVDKLRVIATQPQPELVFAHQDREQRVRARLLIGADGRSSSVRKQLGLTLHETQPRTVCAGMLVRHAPGLLDYLAAGTCGDAYHFLFPREQGVTRLYILWSIEQRQRFAGSDGPRRFLDTFRNYCFPHAQQLAAAEPIGPCVTYPMNDGYLDEPLADNSVLVGDAAGWNDPIVGQGLAIALRDVRMLSEILLADRADWTRQRFLPYVEERRERLRRLRLCARISTEMRCTFTEAGRQRRKAWLIHASKQPWSAATAIAPLLGPEATAAEGYEPEAIERLLALQF
jgi:2-polyprenyl-6-methoxyphenol hydroxylase-like FAD-dependent oxidoreductase